MVTTKDVAGQTMLQEIVRLLQLRCSLYLFFFLNNVFHGASKWYTLQQSKSQLSLIAFKCFDRYVGSDCTNMSSGSFLILDMPLVMMGDNLRYTFSQFLLLYIVLDIRLDVVTLIQIILNTNNNSKALVPIFFWGWLWILDKVFRVDQMHSFPPL